MILRPAIGKSTKPASRHRKRHKNRAARFLVLTLGSGALAALLAIAVAGIPTVLGLVFPTGPTPRILASAIFPPVPAVHRVIDVYDPPGQAPRPVARPPAIPAAEPTAEPGQQPEPSEPGDS